MANRFWRGGTGTWDATTTTNWSTTSGGAGGASAPTAADAVIFDALSGTGTCSTSLGAKCLSLTASAVTANTKFSRNSNDPVVVSGSVTFGASATKNLSGIIIQLSGATGTVTVAGTAVADLYYASGTYSQAATNVEFGMYVQGATVTCTGAFTGTSIQADSGSLTTGAFTHTLNATQYVGLIASGTSTLNITNSTFNILGSAVSQTGTDWSVASTVTLTTTGSTINLGQSANQNSCNFLGGNKTYNVVNIIGYGNLITGANTFATLTITSSPFIYNATYITGNQTVTGTFTASGNSIANRLWLISASAYAAATVGTPRTITLSSATASTKTVRWCNSQDITLTVTGSAVAFTSVGDCLGNTGFTFTTPVTRYAVTGGTAKSYSSTTLWSATSGGATGATVPLPQDTVVFDASTGAGAITVDIVHIGKDISISGSPSITVSILNQPNRIRVYGSTTTFAQVALSFASLSSGGELLFMGRLVAYTIPTNSVAGQYGQCILAGINSTFTLTGNITSNIASVYSGTFNMAGFNLTTTGYQYISSDGYGSTFSQLPVLAFGTSRITCAAWQLDAYAINASSVLNLCTIAVTSGGFVSSITGIAYGTLEFGNGNLIFGAGSLASGTTWVTWTNTNTAPCRLTLETGVTYTVTNFNVNGTKPAWVWVNVDPPFGGGVSPAAILAIGASKTTSFLVFNNITKSGASTLTALGVANAGFNTGILFPTPFKAIAFTGNAGSDRTGSFVVPSDFAGSSAGIAIGGGGGGFTTSGGCGGGFSASYNFNIVAGQTVYYTAGKGGAAAGYAGGSWISTTTNVAPVDEFLGAHATGGGPGSGSEGTSATGKLGYLGGGVSLFYQYNGGGGSPTLTYGLGTAGGSNTAGVGGGGGGGGIRGNGFDVASTTGGAGGLNASSASAAGGAIGVAGTAGTLGGGGGGGGQGANGGAGAAGNEFQYIQLNGVVGSGLTGGGGGGGSAGTGGATTGGAGGIGAGGGSGGGGAGAIGGVGGVGLVLFIYSISGSSARGGVIG